MATAKKSADSGFLKEFLKKLADSEFQIADSDSYFPPPPNISSVYRKKMAILAINSVDFRGIDTEIADSDSWWLMKKYCGFGLPSPDN